MHNKPHLILIHGALGSKEQFHKLIQSISDNYEIHTFDLPAHGNLAYQRDSLSMYSFANYVRNYIVENNLDKPLVFGFSMGGFVALTLQSQGDYFSKIMTLNTKLEWSLEIAEKEQKMFDPEIILEKVPNYANSLIAIHGEENWKNLLEKHRNMMFDIAKSSPLSDYAISNISLPTLITKGEKDKMVTGDECHNLIAKLSDANYYEFENAEHPIEKMDLGQLTKVMNDFYLK